MKPRKKVAVIGAGLAGLSAAYRLRQLAVDVDVFEAKNRVGGRVFTVLMENYAGEMAELELGAQNITDGGEALHFLNLAREFKLSIQEKAIDINILVQDAGQSAYYNELLEKHPKDFRQLSTLAEKAKNMGELIELFCEDNTLLKKALFARMMAYEGLNPYEQSIYHNIETLAYTLAGGVAKAHEAYKHDYDQIVTSFIKGGNALLPLAIAKHLEGNIHYKKALSKISIQETTVFLEFQDRSIYHYDYVIVAIPVATFKNIDFSHARIDQARLNKIQSIRCGANYKIALALNLNRTNAVSSVIKDNVISFYNNDDSLQLLYVNDQAPDIQDFSNFLSTRVHKTPAVSLAPPMQAEGEHYRRYSNSLYYNWKQDVYTQGSYTGYSTSLSDELDTLTDHLGTPYKNLFSPVQERLFFAGEHTTILDCIGTMEAAVESGERVAKAIHRMQA